jgi:cell division protein FtsW
VTAYQQGRNTRTSTGPRTVAEKQSSERGDPARVEGRTDAAAVESSRRIGIGHLRYDQILAGAALCLLAVGLVMVFSVSSAVGFFREDGDINFYFRQQMLVALAGLVFMIVLARIDYRRMRPLAPLALAAAVGLMVLVHVPGFGLQAGGATRWLALGPVSLQPSEVAKIAVILISAKILATRRAQRADLAGLLPLGLIVGAVCLMILWQRDLGTALVIGVVMMGLLWVAGMRLAPWLALSVSGIGLVLLAILTEDYRRQRFLAFLDPFSQAQDSGFQIVQSILALGSGGWFGVGPGLSVQKFSYLPEAHTDMILAVLGEEFGLAGVGLVIALFVALAVSGFAIARRCRDPFGRFIAAGCTFLIVGQAAINMGGVMGAVPLTGVPLPLISYGRTNLLVVFLALGLTLSVARFGPQAERVTACAEPQEPVNVTHIDSRRRHGGTRGPRPRHS